MDRDDTLRDTSSKTQESRPRLVPGRQTYLSHSEKRSGRGSCLVSEWSPVAWEQELSRGRKPGTGKETSPQQFILPSGLYVPTTPQPLPKDAVLPGPDTGRGSWEVGGSVGAPCSPETPSWAALGFGGPLRRKEGTQRRPQGRHREVDLRGHLLAGGLCGWGRSTCPSSPDPPLRDAGRRGGTSRAVRLHVQ